MSQDVRRFTATIASAAALSNEVDLGKSYSKVYLEITGDVDAEMRLSGASEKAGTFRPIYYEPADGTPAVGLFKIASSITDGMVALPALPRYVKVVTTAAVADGIGLYFVGVD